MPRFDVTLRNPEPSAHGSITASLHARDAAEAIAAVRRGYPGYVVAEVIGPRAVSPQPPSSGLPSSQVRKPR